MIRKLVLLALALATLAAAAPASAQNNEEIEPATSSQVLVEPDYWRVERGGWNRMDKTTTIWLIGMDNGGTPGYTAALKADDTRMPETDSWVKTGVNGSTVHGWQLKTGKTVDSDPSTPEVDCPPTFSQVIVTPTNGVGVKTKTLMQNCGFNL